MASFRSFILATGLAWAWLGPMDAAQAQGIGQLTTTGGHSPAHYDYPGEYAQRFDGIDKGGKDSPTGSNAKRLDTLSGLQSLTQFAVGSLPDAGSGAAANVGGTPQLRTGVSAPPANAGPPGSAVPGPALQVPRAALSSNTAEGKSSTWIRMSQPTTSGPSPVIGTVKGANPAPRIAIRK